MACIPRVHTLAAALLLGALALPASAAEEAPAELQNRTGPTEGFVAEEAAGMLTLAWRPNGDRMPVTIVLSEEAGGILRANRYTEQLLGAGIATLLLEIEDGDAAAVLTKAATALAHDPRFLPWQIGAIGFGAGGQAVAAAQFRFAARAMLYPGCGELRGKAAPAAFWAGRPMLLMHGTEDPANPSGICGSAAESLGMAGARIQHTQHRHAGYAWDWPRLRSERRFRLFAPGMAERVVVAPWPELAELTAGQVATFFSQAFRAASQ